MREAGAKDNGETKYDSVTGAKDYRWLESEMSITCIWRTLLTGLILIRWQRKLSRPLPSMVTSSSSLPMIWVNRLGRSLIFRGTMCRTKLRRILMYDKKETDIYD